MESVCLETSVTALHRDDGVLLIGTGGELHVVKDANDERVGKVFHLFDGGNCSSSSSSRDDGSTDTSSATTQSSASIHKFLSFPSSSGEQRRYLAFGGKDLVVFDLSFEHGASDVIVINRWTAEDWIIDVLVTSSADVYVLTAHNVLLLLDRGFQRVKRRILCPELKCILYSGLVVVGVASQSPPVVLAGTVFQELVVWREEEESATTSESPCGRVKARLRGHEGVLFSVNYHPDLGLIVTTSDDRTARVWKVGAGGSGLENGDVECVAVFQGHHTARVFRSAITLDNNRGDSPIPIVITAGEDSLIGIWELESGGRLLSKSRHGDSPIWSLIVDHVEEGGNGGTRHGSTVTLFTGGGDAAVRKQSIELLRYSDRRPSQESAAASGSEGIRSLNNKIANDVTGSSSDFPKVLAQINDLELVCLTNGGSVYRVDDSTCTPLFKDDDLYNYGLCQVEPSSRRLLLAFATLKGQVIVYEDEGGIRKHQLHEGKIFAMQFFGDRRLLLTFGDDVMKLTSYDARMEVLETVGEFVLPKGSQWFTCAVMPNERLLVVGDRNGSIHAYDVTAAVTSRLPVQSLFRIHGRIGVSDLKCFGGRVYSTGRDGVVRVYAVAVKSKNERSGDHSSSSSCCLDLVSATKTKLQWTEKISMLNQQVIVQGFHSSKFVVYSLTEDSIMYETECGGSHRSWTSSLRDHADNDGQRVDDGLDVRFTFIKERRCFQRQNRIGGFQDRFVKPPLHSKEINCVHAFTTGVTTAADRSRLIASGGEDTLIKLWSIVSGSGSGSGGSTNDSSLRHVKTLTGHISSVKAIKAISGLYEDESSSTILVSGGGRAQLKVWRITSGVSDTAAAHQVNAVEMANHMLKGNDKFRKKKTWKSHQIQIPDPETRYLDIDLKSDKDGGSSCRQRLEICVACSDGHVRLFHFRTESDAAAAASLKKAAFLELLFESAVHTHAIQKVLYWTRSSTAAAAGDRILWASTDGHLRLWRPHKDEEEEEGFSADDVIKVHQSGVNALDRTADKVLTGGDDCAIAMTSLFGNDVTIKTFPACHAAQISELRVLDSSGDRVVFATCSVDQRVTIWELTSDDAAAAKPVELRLKTQAFSHIPQIQSMAAWKTTSATTSEQMNMVCVAGVGLQLFAFKDKH